MLKRLLPLAVVLACSSATQAGLFDDDEARKQISEMRQNYERRLNELSEQIKQQDTRGGQKLIDLVNQLDGINQELAKLRGQIEVLTFNLESLQKRQKDLYVDLDGRLRAIEESGPKAATPADTAQQAQRDADAASTYEAAYNLYREGKFKGAVDAFSALVNQHPSSQVTPNAWFWLGMSQAQAKDSRGAIQSFRKLVDGWAEHPKAPDALRAIATLQLEQGDRRGATRTLKELTGAYPGTDAAREAEKQLKKL
ncbi:tol-pal system protein YbgF [Chitinimonas lacunae]|uniref:Cell division coordinator CpoB n=1 Tax=Chitinimonas lacunae TaxID=1963018 RepID=A0ABV8MV21_9NEIS